MQMLLCFRVYNLLVADIMKTNLYYISYRSTYGDLKSLLDKSDLRSYPLVDAEGNEICHNDHLQFPHWL